MNASQIKALRNFCKDKLDKKITKFREDELVTKKLALARLGSIGEEFRIQYNAVDAFINANGKLSLTLELPEEYQEKVSDILPMAYPKYNSASDLRKYLDEKINGTLLELSLMGDVAADNIMHKVNKVFE